MSESFCGQCGARRPPIDGEGFCMACATAEIKRLQNVVYCYEAMKEGVGIRIGDLEAKIERLQEEVAIDNRLLADRERLLSLFECPAHGQCIPYAIEEVGRLRAIVDAVKKYAACKAKAKKGPTAEQWAKYEAEWQKVVQQATELAAAQAAKEEP